MPTSPHMPSHNAGVVIRERIKERRLFEAQFLFGLLDEDDMPGQERLALERELDGLLAIVRDLQLQANKYLAEGEHDLARKMHREMERIAIDVPGLEFSKSRIEEQESASRASTVVPAAKPVDQSGNAGGESAGARSGRLRHSALPVQVRQWWSAFKRHYALAPKGKLLLVGIVLVLLIFSVLFLNLMRREYSDASLRARAERGVAIKPLSVRPGESGAMHADSPEQTKVVPSEENGPAVNIKIGTLSVESGSGQ